MLRKYGDSHPLCKEMCKVDLLNFEEPGEKKHTKDSIKCSPLKLIYIHIHI